MNTEKLFMILFVVMAAIYIVGQSFDAASWAYVGPAYDQNGKRIPSAYAQINEIGETRVVRCPPEQPCRPMPQ